MKGILRNIIITCTLIIVFIAGSIFFDVYIGNVSNDMLKILEHCDSHEDIQELTDQWDKRAAIAELIIDHSEIDMLNQYLWSMEVEIDCDYDEFLESKKLATEMFKHIAERNIFGINNIF